MSNIVYTIEIENLEDLKNELDEIIKRVEKLKTLGIKIEIGKES